MNEREELNAGADEGYKPIRTRAQVLEMALQRAIDTNDEASPVWKILRENALSFMDEQRGRIEDIFRVVDTDEKLTNAIMTRVAAEFVAEFEAVKEDFGYAARFEVENHLMNEYFNMFPPTSDGDFKVPQVVLDYCDEGEHQDGFEYWSNFKSLDDVATDFKTYLENKD